MRPEPTLFDGMDGWGDSGRDQDDRDEDDRDEDGRDASGPRVVHVKAVPEGSCVYIGRPSPWGNPFTLSDPRDERERDKVIRQYREWFAAKVAGDAKFRASLEQLRGHDLGCWCKTAAMPDRACHGDVILEWLATNPAPVRS